MVSSDVKVKTELADKANLPEATRQIIGDKPVYNFAVTSGSKTVTSLGAGKATISLPYTLSANERASQVLVYMINAKGEPELVKNCKYDPETKTVSFTTAQTGKYALAYQSLSFKDFSPSANYASAVEFVTARKLFSNTAEDTFSPNKGMTRGMFVSVLASLEGINTAKFSSTKFKDLSSTVRQLGQPKRAL